MDPGIASLSSNSNNVRQDIFPLDQWTITTRKGIIMQSKCTCIVPSETQTNESSVQLCNICNYYKLLPQLYSMPDMLFNNNVLKLEHFTGIGIEFNALDALKLVEETKDPLQVAVADGWQSARADFPFAKSIVKPFDWTFTSDYKGTLLQGSKKPKRTPPSFSTSTSLADEKSQQTAEDSTSLLVEETNERIDVNKLKVKEEILFYDDVTLYEDELADHGTAQYSVKIRVMPKCLFILARFYLRVDGVLARINDTRIYHELNKRYLLREYTNREAKLSSINLPVSTVINPNELMSHLPLIKSSYEKLSIPRLR